MARKKTRKRRKSNNINNYYNFSEEDLNKLFKKKRYKKVVEWEETKEEVRYTKEWLELKCFVAHRQDMKDPITGQKLTTNANLHHMNLHEEDYGDLNSDNFVMLNILTHKVLHFLSQNAHRLGSIDELFERLRPYLEKMEKLNKDMKTFPLAR